VQAPEVLTPDSNDKLCLVSNLWPALLPESSKEFELPSSVAHQGIGRELSASDLQRA